MSSATPFFRSFATQTFATPKNLSLNLEALVDKEVAKLVEEINEELVMDVVVEGVVDKEVTKVVEEVNKELVKEVTEGLVLVCRYSARRGNHKIGGGGAGQGG